jgi:hypothetical protein
MKYVLVLLCLLTHSVADACQCGPLDEAKAFAGVEAVLLVRVTKTELVLGTPEHVEATVEVVEAFKGKATDLKSFRTRTPLGNGDCSEPIVTGERYLLYVPKSGTPAFGTCSASRYFNEVREEQWLTKHRRPK